MTPTHNATWFHRHCIFHFKPLSGHKRGIFHVIIRYLQLDSLHDIKSVCSDYDRGVILQKITLVVLILRCRMTEFTDMGIYSIIQRYYSVNAYL